MERMQESTGVCSSWDAAGERPIEAVVADVLAEGDSSLEPWVGTEP